MLRQLARKIADSKQGIADKKEPPVTILHAQSHGVDARVDYETIGTGFRFTAHISSDTFANTLGLAVNFGVNYLKQTLPFGRMLE